MMHIEYDDTMMGFYEDYIKNTFRQNVEDLRHCYVFDYKQDKNMQLDVASEKFLDYLLADGHLWEIASTPADKLEGRIREYQRMFPGFGLKKKEMKHTVLYKCVYALFVDMGYAHLDAPRLFDAIGADVCPYCNRVFVKAVKTNKDYADIEKGKKVVRGELDHFYAKELYPFLAVSKYNLVPSCSYCNGVYGKHTHDAITKKLHNPYLIKPDHSDCHFEATFTDGKLLSLKECAEGIRIDLKCEPCMESNKKEFNLQELYDSHKDFAAELYQIAQMRTKQQYFRYVKNSLEKHGRKVTKEDILRMMVHTYVNPKDYNKRPLSKFVNDIAKDLGLLG